MASDAKFQRKKSKERPKPVNGELRFECSYCKVDISKEVRVKCLTCTSFSLCLNCCRFGVEVFPHERTHPYTLLKGLNFPLVDQKWSADEEILLTEAIGLFGLGNWEDVAKYVGTHSLSDCEAHYFSLYYQHPEHPEFDSTKKLLGVRMSATQKRSWGSKHSKEVMSSKKKDAEKLATYMTKRRREVKNTKIKALDPFMVDELEVRMALDNVKDSVTSYNHLRNEFEVEFDNEAEGIVKNLLLSPDDTPEEVSAKLKVMGVYNRKLKDRELRTQVVLNYGLHKVKQCREEDSQRTPQLQHIHRQMRPFTRFLRKRDYSAFMKGLEEEVKLRNWILRLQAYRQLGITSLEEGNTYELEMIRRNRAGDASAATVLPRRVEARVVPNGGIPTSGGATDSLSSGLSAKAGNAPNTAGPESSERLPPGGELLSPDEKRILQKLNLRPTLYRTIKMYVVGGMCAPSVLHVSKTFDIDKPTADALLTFMAANHWLPAGSVVMRSTKASNILVNEAMGADEGSSGSDIEELGEEEEVLEEEEEDYVPEGGRPRPKRTPRG